MAIRKAPKTGYDFGQKRQYRRDVWATFKRCTHGSISDAKVALMPSLEGDEIEVAKANGFREHNIAVIDRNPAIVATIKRRFPKVATFGVDAARAAERVAEWADGKLAAVNLDLCGGADRPLFETLIAWAQSRALADCGHVAVTVLRGRERKWAFAEKRDLVYQGNPETFHQIQQALTPRDSMRVAFISMSLAGRNPVLLANRFGRLSEDENMRMMARSPYIPRIVRAGTYRSTAGSQTMMWSVYCLHKNPCLCDACSVQACSFMPTNPSGFAHFMRLQGKYASELVSVWGHSNTERPLDGESHNYFAEPFVTGTTVVA